MRQSLRIFRNQPAFAAAVVIVLALATGANSALFTVVDALMLRPLPFPHPDQLVEISFAEQNGHRPEHTGRIEDLARTRSFESAGAYLAWNFAVTNSNGVRMAFSVRVTPDLMTVLGAKAARGRMLTRADFGQKVLMISDEYWRSLGAPADIVGRNLILDRDPYAIIGVLPPNFFLGVRDIKFIVPNLEGAGRTVARLHRGVTPAQAQSEIASLVPNARIEVVPLARAFFSNDFKPILLLNATAGFVLLLTCANLANLQLVRGFARRREYAVRAALGASRVSLILESSREGALLAVAGTLLGFLLSRALRDVIIALLPENISRRLSGAMALSIDGRIIAVTCAIGLVTAVLFALLPAFSSLRFDVMARLRDAGRDAVGGRRSAGQALVVVEIALALMLLAGAGLTFKNLTRLQQQYLGFHAAGVLRAMTDFPADRYATPSRQAALYDQVQHRIGALPDVAAVGLVAPQAFPFGGPSVRGARFEIAGQPGVEARAEVYAANPAYLDAIGLPLLRGRWFQSSDTLDSRPVAVLSESVARRYWGGLDCLQSVVRLDAGQPRSVWATVVGIVGDVKNPTADHRQPTAYRPFAQTPSTAATLLVRSRDTRPLDLAPLVRRELHVIDPTAPEFRIAAPLDAAIHDYVSPQRFTASLSSIFAAIGLALAATGVYGVIRFWVVSRTAEIGIRMALGARTSDVLALVLGRAAMAAGAGVAAGLAGSLAVGELIGSLLIGVSGSDPLVLSLVAALIFAVALLAAWLPARWASRLDPAQALHRE